MNFLFYRVAQLLFPEPCVHCLSKEKVGTLLLCADCESLVPKTLTELKKREIPARIFSLGGYGDPLGSLIRRGKYKPDPIVFHLLAQRLLSACRSLPRFEAVVHVPIPKKRILYRGFDQSAILASAIGRANKVPHYYALKRMDSIEQASRSQVARREKLSFRFESISTLPKTVLLVDDVFTTGATLESCSMALLNNGVRHVLGVTLASVEL